MKAKLAAAAILVAVAVVVSGAVVLGSATPRAASTLPTPGSPVVLSSPEPTVAYGALLGLSAAQVHSIDEWVASLTPAQLATLRSDASQGLPGTPAVLAELNLEPDAYNGYCVATSLVAGASIGAIAGGGVGAVVGLVAGGVGAYFYCQVQSNGAQLLADYQAYAGSVMGALDNYVNLTSAGFLSIISALNVSEVAWERAADNAALLQLSNSSFNYGLDLYQSGIFAQLDPVLTAYFDELGQSFLGTARTLEGHLGVGAVYSNSAVSSGMEWGSTSIAALSCNAAGTSNVCSASIAHRGVAVHQNSLVYIPHGATITNLCTGATAATFTGETNPTVVYFNQSAAGGTFNFTGPSGVYQTNTGGGSCGVTNGYAVWSIPNGGYVPSGGSTNLAPVSATYNGPMGTETTGNGLASCPLPEGCTSGVYGVGYLSTPAWYIQMKYTSTVPFETTQTLYDNLATYIGNIEYDAAANANAYWTFLTALGFTSAAQVPADCIVPAPYMVLPSGLSGLTLNASEWYSMYLGMLEGMGTFYNGTSLSQTTFCGTQSTHQFSIGSDTIWGNLFVNATGYVYLNNGTSPVSVDGTAFPSENYSNTSTWAIGNTTHAAIQYKGAQQLLLMPTISTVSIPVGQKWAVPSNDPVRIYAVQSGVMFNTEGNGTAVADVGLAPLVSLPGDSIYLDTCTISGSATQNCTVSVQTLNVTVANISCTGACEQSAPGGTFGGFPNPFNWLSSLFSSLLGGGPLGQFVGSLLAGVLLLGAVAVIVYLVISGLTKRRSGGGGAVTASGGRG